MVRREPVAAPHPPTIAAELRSSLLLFALLVATVTGTLIVAALLGGS
ncbi:MAG: hypothetical protein ACR2F6_10545 [Mycobacteriales bacterium]